MRALDKSCWRIPFKELAGRTRASALGAHLYFRAQPFLPSVLALGGPDHSFWGSWYQAQDHGEAGGCKRPSPSNSPKMCVFTNRICLPSSTPIFFLSPVSPCPPSPGRQSSLLTV